MRTRRRPGRFLARRRSVLDDVNTIEAYAKEMRDFLKHSDLTERKAFIQSFVKEIVVMPGDALLRYTVPMPSDSMIPGKAIEKLALNDPVLASVHRSPLKRVQRPIRSWSLRKLPRRGYPVITVITGGSSSSATLIVTCMLSMAPDGSVAVTTTV